MSELQDEVNAAGMVASASSKAMFRAVLIGVVPIVEFGILISLTLLIVALPLKLMRRGV